MLAGDFTCSKQAKGNSGYRKEPHEGRERHGDMHQSKEQRVGHRTCNERERALHGFGESK